MFHKPSTLSLLSLLLFLSTLTSTSAASFRRAEQTIRWVDCHNRVPDPIAEELNLTSATWIGTLPSNLHCGEMDVPMDYTKPFNAITNNITIGFAMNRPTKPASGLILYHAGGPGENAAAQAWANALNLSAAFAGLEDFDFLAINTRGIQFSNPLNLTTGVFFNNVSFAFPSSQAEFDQYHAAMTNFYNAAIKDSTPPGIMQHVGTTEVIQDWDTMRAALGYDTVSFAGISYGTFVGMAYAAKYPDRVDQFVLDAVLPHGMSLQDMVTIQVVAINRLVQRADAFCHVDPTCPFYGQGNGSVVQAWQAALAQSIQAPLPALSCGPGTGCNAPVTPTDLRQGAAFLFNTDPDFPLFNIGLNASLHGDASIFAYQPDLDLRDTILAPLLCSDFKLDPGVNTWAGFNNLSLNSDSSDPLHIIYSQTWQFFLQCTAWPYPVAEDIARVTLPTDLELMWLTSDFDYNVPTEMTTFAWQQAPNSTVVIRHGDDHTSILNPPPSDVAGNLARNFLRTGVMPGPSSDVAVTVIGPGGTRGPVPGAYDVPVGAVAGDASSVENIT
ncbi:Alpha/Beta hydrolase protein [Mycena galopus ATCC 62051]|nr:Alpha/Beta hydrolase protein [Mycena galopus ATCC 62051]